MPMVSKIEGGGRWAVDHGLEQFLPRHLVWVHLVAPEAAAARGDMTR